MLLPEKLLVLAPSITEPHIAIFVPCCRQAGHEQSAASSMWARTAAQSFLASVYCEGYMTAVPCVIPFDWHNQNDSHC